MKRERKRTSERERERYATSRNREHANDGGGRRERAGRGGGWKSNGITEAGGRWCSGAEISFYGRVTNLRTRHCRVPADGRTMRLRNTMLHSGNLKAVLTTNLQPPHTVSLCAPLGLPSPGHPRLPILAPSTHTSPLHCRVRHAAAAFGPRRYFLILSPLTRAAPFSTPSCTWEGPPSRE